MDASPRQSGDVVEEATSTCSEYVTAQIELSKRHWSELSGSMGDGISREEVAKAKLDNRDAFRIWESHPKWHTFFMTFGDDSEVWASLGSLEVGEKFAEGAQAELFHAGVKWSKPEQNEVDLERGTKYVLKVFKEGTLVRDMLAQWPEGLFRCNYDEINSVELGKPLRSRYICHVVCATLLEDGRFAYLMVKEDGDLRSLIECKIAEGDHGCGPFSKEVGEEIMHRVALGMECLHEYDIIHRDLKASNVLVTTSPCGHYIWCSVADYESSIGVIGTGFWRAPEVLRALKEKSVFKSPELFSRKADSYSYGMTFYEVLTGRMPFEEHPLLDQHSLLMDLVINQHLRPEVPDYVEDCVLELLHWCWKPSPEERPSFKEIMGILEANSKCEYMKERVKMAKR